MCHPFLQGILSLGGTKRPHIIVINVQQNVFIMKMQISETGPCFVITLYYISSLLHCICDASS